MENSFYNDGRDKKEEKGYTGRAQDEAKVRKTLPQVTCAWADARVWFPSPRSPNRCRLLSCEGCKQVVGLVHTKSTLHTAKHLHLILRYFSTHKYYAPHALQNFKI